jgi:biopolymer transport protein ExbD
MAFSAGGGPSTAEMNVTPLIDVLLVLIIIFMVVVTQQRHEGLDAQIPQPKDKSSEKNQFAERTIVIQVVEDAKHARPGVKINQEDVAWENLGSRLHDIFKTRAERIAFVRGEDDVDFQYVADAIDLAREAGVEKVGLLGRQ